MNRLFVDTSGWIALVNRSDVLHVAATTIYNERFAGTGDEQMDGKPDYVYLSREVPML